MEDTRVIAVSYEPTLLEQIHAVRAYDATGSASKVNKIVAGLLLAFGIWSVSAAGAQWWAFLPFPLAVIEWFDLLSIRPLQARIAFRTNPKFRERYEIEFGDKGIHFKTPTIDSEIAWSHYSKVVETDRVFLLVYGRSMYSVIPKRAFSGTEEVDAFRSMVNHRIVENRQ